MGIRYCMLKYYFPDLLTKANISNMPTYSGLVLNYHEVLPEDFKLPAWTVVKEKDFRWQINYLEKSFDIVTLDQALNKVTHKMKSRKPFAVITFDDGYKGNLDIVLPIMKAKGLPYTVYVATKAVVEGSAWWYDKIISLLGVTKRTEIELFRNGHTENYTISQWSMENTRWKRLDRILTALKAMKPKERKEAVCHILGKYCTVDIPFKMLSADQLQKLAASGCVTIGAHTHNHELLDQLQPHDISETILTANEHIKRITGSQPRHFCFPNGNYNDEVLRYVKKACYSTAVTVVPGIWSSPDCCYEIPRISIGRFDCKSRFKAKIARYL